jgi:hypothetical protein
MKHKIFALFGLTAFILASAPAYADPINYSQSLFIPLSAPALNALVSGLGMNTIDTPATWAGAANVEHLAGILTNVQYSFAGPVTTITFGLVVFPGGLGLRPENYFRHIIWWRGARPGLRGWSGDAPLEGSSLPVPGTLMLFAAGLVVLRRAYVTRA